MRVRRGSSGADFGAAAELWYRALSARRGAPADAEERDRVRAWSGQPGVVLVLAVDGEVPVGSAVALPARGADGAGEDIPGMCHVSTVAVSPERWGEGIGRRVIAALLDEARAAGYLRAQLWSRVSNTRAIALYEVLGFARTGRTATLSDGELNLHFARDL